MKKLGILSALVGVIVAFTFSSCGKTGPAETASGTYTGNYVTQSGTAPGTLKVISGGDNSCTVEFYVNNSATATSTLGGVVVSESGGNIVFAYSDPTGTAAGTLTGNAITFSITPNSGSGFTFNGSK